MATFYIDLIHLHGYYLTFKFAFCYGFGGQVVTTYRKLILIFTADLISGAEAVAQVLFSRAMPDDSLLSVTRAIVERVAEGATGAFTASKELVAHIRDQRLGLWASMAEENAEQARLCKSEDYAEGFRAFQEKRPPVFKG